MSEQDQPNQPPPSGDSPGGPVYGEVPRYGYQQPAPPTSAPPASYPPLGTEQPYPGQPYQQQYQQPYPGTQQQPYQGPAQQPYQQPYADQPPVGQPYAGQPYSGGYGPPPVPVYPYAPWHRRVGAYLIDYFPGIVASIPFYIGYVIWVTSLARQQDLPPGAVPDFSAGLGWMGVGSLLLLAALGWQIYNRWIVAGRTGQSLGKRVLKIKLVSEATGQPIGALNAFLRDLLHILDGIAYIGYLWPLWDDKRQTFADKLMKTVVPDLPRSDQPVAQGV